MTGSSVRLRWTLIMLLVLGACQTVQKAADPALSASVDDDWRMRHSLQISQENLPSSPTYQPVPGCHYASSYDAGEDGRTERSFLLRIVPVASTPGRLLITAQYDNGASTAVIARDGTLHDFNLLDSDGSRSNRENYRFRARQEATRQNAEGQVTNNFEIAFPRYAQDRWRPGQQVARIAAEDGTTWGVFVYRGTAGNSNWQAAVLDIIRSSPAAGEGVVGFSIVEIATMTPLLLSLETYRHRWRLERVSCP